MKFSFPIITRSAKRRTVDAVQSGADVAAPDNISLRDYVFEDPDLAADIRRFVDNVLLHPPQVVPIPGQKPTVNQLKMYNQQLRDVRFYRLSRSAVYQLLWNGNAFFEIKFNNKKLKEMYSIDPETMYIETYKDGSVKRYRQNIHGKNIYFSPDEIIHISIDHVDSSIMGNAWIKSLKRTLHRKAIAEWYLDWLFSNNKFAPLINIAAEDMTTEVWSQIVQQFRARGADPDKFQDFNSFPEDRIELIRLFSLDDVAKVQEYIDSQKQQIIKVLQVPPIISGTVDNSNRSNSEIQARFVFYNTITAFQNIVEEELNYELLKKLRWEGVQFQFHRVDQRSDLEVLQNVKIMRDLGFTDEAIEYYLRENNFTLPMIEDVFKGESSAPEEPVEEDLDDYDSRQPRDKTGIPENEERRQEQIQSGVRQNGE